MLKIILMIMELPKQALFLAIALKELQTESRKSESYSISNYLVSCYSVGSATCRTLESVLGETSVYQQK